MSNNFDYYVYHERSILKNIEAEIKFYRGEQMDEVFLLDSYLKYLTNRIYNIDMICVNTYGRYGEQIEMKKMNVVEYSKNLDNAVYKRDWVKLKDFHKKKKIVEYINSIQYDESLEESVIMSNRNFLINAINKGIDTKRFKKGCNTIIYNKEKMIIESIECLIFDDDTLTYRLEWV